MACTDRTEKGAKFDILKGREGYYRNWDHQLMQEMYTLTFKKAADVKDKWDLFTISPPVPAASQSLEVLARDAPPLVGMDHRPAGVLDRSVERCRKELDLHALQLVQVARREDAARFG